jgi:hypothetical protein
MPGENSDLESLNRAADVVLILSVVEKLAPEAATAERPSPSLPDFPQVPHRMSHLSRWSE